MLVQNDMEHDRQCRTSFIRLPFVACFPALGISDHDGRAQDGREDSNQNLCRVLAQKENQADGRQQHDKRRQQAHPAPRYADLEHRIADHDRDQRRQDQGPEEKRRHAQHQGDGECDDHQHGRYDQDVGNQPVIPDIGHVVDEMGEDDERAGKEIEEQVSSVRLP